MDFNFKSKEFIYKKNLTKHETKSIIQSNLRHQLELQKKHEMYRIAQYGFCKHDGYALSTNQKFTITSGYRKMQ